MDDEVAEAGAAGRTEFVRIVDEFDGDELVVRKFDHGQVPHARLRDIAHDLVTHGGVERERLLEIGDPKAEVQGPHRLPSWGRQVWIMVPLGNVRASTT